MPRISWRQACLAALVTSAFLLPSSGSAERPKEEPGIAERISWLSEERGHLLFIPQIVLDRSHLDELPVERSSTLRLRLKMKRHPERFRSQFSGGVVPECWPAGAAARQGTDPHPHDLAGLLKLSSEVYVGTIRQIVPGWDFHRNQVGQMAIVEIEERLRAADPETLPPVADEVFVLFGGGTIRVGGTELCDEIPSGYHRPEIGESILLSGYRYPSNSSYFEGRLFAIDGGNVQPQPFAALREEQAPIDLRTLADVLGSDQPELRDGP